MDRYGLRSQRDGEAVCIAAKKYRMVGELKRRGHAI
jgi:hypothetical protein